jgi:hypothetical protein
VLRGGSLLCVTMRCITEASTNLRCRSYTCHVHEALWPQDAAQVALLREVLHLLRRHPNPGNGAARKLHSSAPLEPAVRAVHVSVSGLPGTRMPTTATYVQGAEDSYYCGMDAYFPLSAMHTVCHCSSNRGRCCEVATA